ncbi:Uncharacterised protein [Serratia proteamaculans]|uniref:Uncharacterized protein n=1 Tax=Serratia proteamaculans TaxID=28151 RepID=A0ABS0TM31_SERPR|nr:hypothetical protein [Serratia proteamaculans]KAB1497073.1 hypothetical protein F8R23_12985 [Serratia proteamaculans]MBI6179395.1 hypothetical protein [Serratia proteamaculans]RYM48920.1 hypothetical protein BSQ97_21345 [Serratia proteamaculans]RYM54722.1 hypothetical protein BSQ96_12350 [Serratia proteamaculans]CAI0888153.1 Uncharacterised protein [Serratia proteamaculans]
MTSINKNIGEYDFTAQKRADMITGTISGEFPDSDASLPLLPFSGTFAAPSVAEAITEIKRKFPHIEPAIIDVLRDEMLRAGY